MFSFSFQEKTRAYCQALKVTGSLRISPKLVSKLREYIGCEVFGDMVSTSPVGPCVEIQLGRAN